MKTKILALLLLLIFVFPSVLRADDSSSSTNFVRVEKTNPDKPFSYKVKRLKEKIGLKLRFRASKKVDYYEELTERRLAELKYFSEKKDAAYIEKASQRYETTVGEMVEYITSKGLENRKEDIKKKLDNQKSVVVSLLDNYEYNNAQWRFIKNDENSIDLYQNKL